MADKSGADNEPFDDGYAAYMPGREVMSPELIKSFNEFSQLLHNINIKMASQNDQNLALLRSLESLPSIIKDIPRARELEGDILQEMLVLMKETRTERLKVADRMMDIKTAMMAMEENSKAQISFFEGKERGHRDQMNMMREYIERERRHHRNNLTGVFLIAILIIGMLCAGTFFFLREKFNAFEQGSESRLNEKVKELKATQPQINMTVQAPAVPAIPAEKPAEPKDPAPEKPSDSLPTKPDEPEVPFE
ncbi:hypothetical protein ACFL4W_01850 [Planctomycetota bacterium]